MPITPWLLILALGERSCPPDRTVQVNLPRWAQALKRASPPEADRLLALLHLPALPEGEREAVSVAVLSAGLGSDELVVADFHLKDPQRAYRVQWLRPIRPGVFCALGADLSQDFPSSRRSPCPAGDDEPDTFSELSFRFTPLLNTAKPAVEAIWTTRQSSCRGIRGTIATHSFWEAPAQRMTLALQLSQSDYLDHDGVSTRAWFTLSAQAPRVAEQFTETCEQGETADAGPRCSTIRTRFEPGYLRQDDADAGVE